MHIYKFRLLTDLDDEFIRDIEIQENQTFKDFHNMISKCVNLNGKELASFHICDREWNKFKEITLIDMQIEEGSEKGIKPFEETFCMKNSLIKDFIKEPHQRLLYEYDFFDIHTFFIELLNVHKQKDNKSYPRCTFSKSELLPETIPESNEENGDELKEKLLKEFNDLLDDTYDYKGDSEDNIF